VIIFGSPSCSSQILKSSSMDLSGSLRLTSCRADHKSRHKHNDHIHPTRVATVPTSEAHVPTDLSGETVDPSDFIVRELDDMPHYGDTELEEEFSERTSSLTKPPPILLIVNRAATSPDTLIPENPARQIRCDDPSYHIRPIISMVTMKEKTRSWFSKSKKSAKPRSVQTLTCQFISCEQKFEGWESLNTHLRDDHKLDGVMPFVNELHPPARERFNRGDFQGTAPIPRSATRTSNLSNTTFNYKMLPRVPYPYSSGESQPSWDEDIPQSSILEDQVPQRPRANDVIPTSKPTWEPDFNLLATRDTSISSFKFSPVEETLSTHVSTTSPAVAPEDGQTPSAFSTADSPATPNEPHESGVDIAPEIIPKSMPASSENPPLHRSLSEVNRLSLEAPESLSREDLARYDLTEPDWWEEWDDDVRNWCSS